MNHTPREHVRRQAQAHHERHQKLKALLRHAPGREKVWGTFVTTLGIALISLALYANWGQITDALKPEPPAPLPQTHGFKTGVSATIKVEEQAGKTYLNLLAAIPTAGSPLGAKSAELLGHEPGRTPHVIYGQNASKGVQAATAIATGQPFTRFPQQEARGLSKSVLATVYLGEKTIDINSTLQRDTQLLGKINNALSVDLFEYLNQSTNRADGLESYLRLLRALSDKTKERVIELGSKVAFLDASSQAEATQIQFSQETFYSHLKIFNGPDAEEELGKFLGLQQQNVEDKAKKGAYTGLRDYYLFFQPRLENLITALQANRDALIAGVKVTEIQNMTLPLIIRQR